MDPRLRSDPCCPHERPTLTPSDPSFDYATSMILHMAKWVHRRMADPELDPADVNCRGMSWLCPSNYGHSVMGHEQRCWSEVVEAARTRSVEVEAGH